MKTPARLAALSLALITVGAPSLATAASASEVRHAIWRCAAAGGTPVFRDSPCRHGANPWSPAPIATGIRRSDGRPEPIVATSREQLEPLLPQGPVDPFVDCQRRGGRYGLAARVCHLPPGGTRYWTVVSD